MESVQKPPSGLAKKKAGSKRKKKASEDEDEAEESSDLTELSEDEKPVKANPRRGRAAKPEADEVEAGPSKKKAKPTPSKRTRKTA